MIYRVALRVDDRSLAPLIEARSAAEARAKARILAGEMTRLRQPLVLVGEPVREPEPGRSA